MKCLPISQFHNPIFTWTCNRIKWNKSNLEIYQPLCIITLDLTSPEDLFFLSIPLDIESHERAVTMQANSPNSSPTPSCSPYFCTSFRSAFKMLSQNLLYVILKSLVKFWNRDNCLFTIWQIHYYYITITFILESWWQ